MNVLSICGSLREGSSTGMALDIAVEAARDLGAQVEVLHLRDLELPYCDGRDDESSYGGGVPELIEMVRRADGLIIGSPNYHGSFTGVLKNALDLLGPDAIRDKIVGLVATARGDAGAMNTLNHLRHVCRWMNGWVLPVEVSIPRAHESLVGSVDDKVRQKLVGLGRELVRYNGPIQK